MQIDEIVYKGRDNVIALALSSDGVALEHNQISRAQVLVGATLIDSATTPALFDLTQADRIVLQFGASSLQTGRYPAQLVIFDSQTPNGVVWGSLVITIK